MRLCRSLLLLVALPLAAGEVPLGELHYSPGCEATRSRIASNGHTFYGAWRYTHAGFSSFSGRVRGMALDENGAFLTPNEQPVLTLPSNIAVASNGESYLVATDYVGNLDATFVDAHGRRAADPLNLIAGQGTYGLPQAHSSVAAAWNGTSYIVVGTSITTSTGPERLFAAAITPQGVVTASGIVADDAQVLDAVPAGDGQTLLLLQAGNSLETLLLGGQLQTSAPRTIVGDATLEAALATNGAGFLLVWSAAGTVHGVALDGGGGMAGAPFTIGDGSSPAVAWDGSSYLIVWASPLIEAARSNGNGVTSSFDIAFDFGSSPSVATNAAGDAIVLFAGGCGVVSRRVVRHGAMSVEGAAVPVSVNALDQVGAQIVPSPSGTQVAWSDTSLWLTTIRPDGSVVPARQLGPSGAAFVPMPSGAVLVWLGGAGVQVQKLDGGDAHVFGAAQAFQVGTAVIGDDLGVAWTQLRSVPLGYELYAAILKSDGSLRTSPILSNPANNAFGVTLAAFGDRFLAAWREDGSGESHLQTAILDADAHVLATHHVTDPVYTPFDTVVGTNGSRALMTWWSVGGGSGPVLYGQRLDADGAAVGVPLQLATSPAIYRQVRIVPSGDDFVVVFVTLPDDQVSTVIRRVRVSGGAVGMPETLVTYPGAFSVDTYALRGTEISSVVLSRSSDDPDTNGARRLYWVPFPQPRLRAVRR